MEPTKKVIRYFSDDRAAVLLLSVNVSDALPAGADGFYGDICKAFRDAVAAVLYPSALDAYRACTAPRKRYRYSPMQAEFSVLPCDGGVMLTMGAEGVNRICERHIWRNGMLAKRLRA